jgi:Bardet-Biedl syndrome 2 protein
LLNNCKYDDVRKGFDNTGDEKYWTVTGDNVTALELIDFDGDGQNELLAGSADFSIRVFKGEELIFDINENSKLAALSKIKNCVYGYALSNGSVGVYNNKNRIWRRKNKSKVTALQGVDFDCDGVMEICIGFASG